MDSQKPQQKNSLVYSIYKPSEKLLENWKFCIAYEVVLSWQESSPDKIASKIILDIDDKKLFVDIWNQLLCKIQSEKIARNSFKQAESNVKEFFDEKFLILQKRLKTKKNKTTQTFKESLSANFVFQNPQFLSEEISAYIKLLEKRKKYFESEQSNHLQRQASAGLAFAKLYKKLQSNTSNSNTLDYKCVEQSLWNALEIYFCEKLKANKFYLLSQSAFGLLELCQSYFDLISSSSEIVDKITESLKEKASYDLLSIPVFTHANKIDVSKLKSDIESSVGLRLNHWGSAQVNWEEIEAKILKHMEAVTLKIYQQFEERFFEHGILVNSRSNQAKDQCVLYPAQEQDHTRGLVRG